MALSLQIHRMPQDPSPVIPYGCGCCRFKGNSLQQSMSLKECNTGEMGSAGRWRELCNGPRFHTGNYGKRLSRTLTKNSTVVSVSRIVHLYSPSLLSLPLSCSYTGRALTEWRLSSFRIVRLRHRITLFFLPDIISSARH